MERERERDGTERVETAGERGNESKTLSVFPSRDADQAFQKPGGKGD